MIEGRCPNCGKRYYGWALSQPCNQICNNCGVALLISGQLKMSYESFSPLDAAKYNSVSPLVTEIFYERGVSKFNFRSD